MQAEGKMLNTAGLARDFLNHGFCQIEKIADDETVQALRVEYDKVLSGEHHLAGDRQLGDVIRQVMNPHQSLDVFRDNAALTAAKKIACEVFGGDQPQLFFDMLIYKEPGCESATPWHQDMAYSAIPYREAGARSSGRTVMQFWVALDDVDDETGCMTFLPDVQKNPLLPHHVASGDPQSDSRLLAITNPDEVMPLANSIACPLRAGGATAHSGNTPHMTGPNRSRTRPRRAYIFNLINSQRLADK